MQFRKTHAVSQDTRMDTESGTPSGFRGGSEVVDLSFGGIIDRVAQQRKRTGTLVI
jgi:hypothetical protein